MALSLRKRSSSSGPVGLDIDGRFLAAAEVSDGRLVRVASAELPAGALVDGEVADRAALAGALRDFAASAGLPKDVRLGISNQQIVVRMLELPQIEDPSEREAALRFQAADAIAMPLDEAVLDHQVAGYATNGEGVERMQVVVVAARRTMIDEYLGAARDAGLKPAAIDLDAFAIVRMLSHQAVAPAAVAPLVPDSEPVPVPVDAAPAGEPGLDEPAAPMAARVYCHLGGVSNLAIGVGDSCYFTRTLSTRFDSEDAATALANEIRMSLDYYMAQPNALPVGDALLSGEGTLDDGLVADIGAQLGVPFTAAEPLGSLEAEAVADDDPRRYTVAAGLAVGAAQ